jgi:hypothetical protein
MRVRFSHITSLSRVATLKVIGTPAVSTRARRPHPFSVPHRCGAPITLAQNEEHPTSTNVELDTATWVIAGSVACDVHGCSQEAAIIADLRDRDRFCVNHTTEAAAAALLHPEFGGWYRITGSRYDGARLVATVHPL